MANFVDPPTGDRLAEWEAYKASRPDKVRELCEKFPPWKLYRLKTDDGRPGHRVTIYSIDEHEDGSCSFKVDVTGDFNFVAFERRVFGIKPEDLEECELPGPEETLGSADMPIEIAIEHRKNRIAGTMCESGCLLCDRMKEIQ